MFFLGIANTDHTESTIIIPLARDGSSNNYPPVSTNNGNAVWGLLKMYFPLKKGEFPLIGFLRGVVIPLIIPNVPQSSQTESLGFPSYPLPLNTPPLRILEHHAMLAATSISVANSAKIQMRLHEGFQSGICP